MAPYIQGIRAELLEWTPYIQGIRAELLERAPYIQGIRAELLEMALLKGYIGIVLSASWKIYTEIIFRRLILFRFLL